MTERELADLNGLVRIWDTGKIRYVINKDNDIVTLPSDVEEPSVIITPQVKLDNESKARSGKKRSIEYYQQRKDRLVVLKDQYEASDKNSLSFEKLAFQAVVWWVGECGHEFESKTSSRMSGRDCPYCAGRQVLVGFNDFPSRFPDLASSFSSKNDFDIYSVTYGSRQVALWECDNGHEWEASFYRRSLNSCPLCSNRKILVGFNDVATTHPHLIHEWDENNTVTLHVVVAGSDKILLWKCQQGHQWESKVSKRALRGSGCPYCSNKKVLVGFNDLATTYPDIAAQWHPDNELSPQEVVAGSAKKVWWKCARGHEWSTTVGAMVNAKHLCSKCRNSASAVL